MDDQAMEVIFIPLTTIQVGTRRRDLDETAVREIAQSIERQGLLQPIGVTLMPDQAEDRYSLIFGAHRLEACKRLAFGAIEARILPSGLSSDEYMLMELEENCERHDLTRAQRKAYAGEVGQLLSKLSEKFNSLTGTDLWLIAFGQKTNTPRSTLYSWWKAFCNETEGMSTVTPKHALTSHQTAFFAWLEAQQAKEAAEKAQKEAEAFAQRRRRDIDDALDNLRTLEADYGRETVIEEIINVFLADGNADE